MAGAGALAAGRRIRLIGYTCGSGKALTSRDFTTVRGIIPTLPARMAYDTVIGLEIHAQLLTATKIFCGCSTRFGAPPNTHVCPVCLGLPGALPVLNRRAVDLAVRAGLALGCAVNARSEFARKNYFYPDLPKGYQISQYDRPIVATGLVEIPLDGRRLGVRLTRIHLEEDAGKSLHEGTAELGDRTGLDFNRAGVPLVEIVTEPDLRSAADAAIFFEHLRDVLVWIGVSDGNMEEGSLRCDANVSIRPADTTRLGTKVEVKNLNSFKYLRQALEYEIDRQVDLVERGEAIVQETRLWDQAASRTISMRSKEDAHDYRYFPEPDLPPVDIDDARLAEARAALPELPAARRARYGTSLGLPPYDATELTRTRETGDWFEAVVAAGAPAKAAANWMMGEMARALNDAGVTLSASPVSADALAGLIRLIEQGTISSTTAKQVFERMWTTKQSAAAIVAAEGLAQISDASALEAAVDAVIATHTGPVTQYRSGQTKVLGFLVGQVMRATGGKASPAVVTDLLRKRLAS
jgi:aspartyl-tRNA(Asn)/glutamyl-tRNA(Gln) amidotransferase subunit B